MKALKWLLIVGGSLVVLLIAALLLIPLFVDVDKYKPEIEKQVSSAVGRPFAIKARSSCPSFPGRGWPCRICTWDRRPGTRKRIFSP